MSSRYPELDVLRGAAVVSMIIYHFFFDLDFLGISQHSMYAGGWLVFQRMIASSFLLLVGISLTISFSHVREKPFLFIFKKFLKRAGYVMVVALLVTLGTWLAVPEAYVRFGILHLIAVSTLLSLPFLFISPFFAGFVGVGFLFASSLIKSISVSHPFFLWLGITYPGFSTVDYFPVVPWFGIVLLGIFLGKWLYPKGERKYHWLSVPTANHRLPAAFVWIGRKALWIYLVHQPILVGILMLVIKAKTL
ncbi:MAG: heparan-alpha-glucosaminide N-acetyltransferase [Candidatus Woesearchaeota archaeon]|nr:heparan-alpha-glucosaminide N-acetyltransferase [Candidatus Woesearchaeota archaeon]